MKIAIICDLLMKKELGWCEIGTEISLGIHSTVTICYEQTNVDHNNYSLIILWTHGGDEKDYSEIISMCEKSGKFIHIHFEKSIQHMAINCTNTFTRANYQLHECPPYYAYSKYWKALRLQIKQFIKDELLKKIS